MQKFLCETVTLNPLHGQPEIFKCFFSDHAKETGKEE